MKLAKNKEILTVNDLISRCVNKGLSVEAIMALIDFKDELQEKVEKYQKAFKTLMSNHGVNEENGVFKWQGLENEKEITEQVTELLDAETELNHANFLEKEEAIKLFEGMNVGEISYLMKYIKK